MFAPKLAPETVNVAVVDAELAQEVNADKLVADSVINGVVHAATVTELEAALIYLQEACILTVITSPLDKAAPLMVHVEEVITVVVPQTTPFLYTVTIEPLASVLVPDTDVALVQIGEFSTGVAEVA